MAYEPTVWQTGDVVTSARLNKMENGIAGAGGGGGGVLVVGVTETTENGSAISTLDKTWQEMNDADLVVVVMTDENEVRNMKYSTVVDTIGTANGIYTVFCGDETYTTDSANGYPSYESGK